MDETRRAELTAQYTIIYNNLIEIRSIFNEYFGEERVDTSFKIPTLEEFISYPAMYALDTNYLYIYVHYPKLTITNELNHSKELTNLWVRIPIRPNGSMRGSFEIGRSTYTLNEASIRYKHSHTSGSIDNFSGVCLGGGPIRRTINTLSANYDANIWLLFVVELDKYMHTESLAGGPFIRLSSIPLMVGYKVAEYNQFPIVPISGRDNPILDSRFLSYPIDKKKRLIKGIIDSKSLKFVYKNNRYHLGMPFAEAVRAISKVFIDIYNQDIKEATNYSELRTAQQQQSLLSDAQIINNKITVILNKTENSTVDAIHNVEPYQGSRLFTFKGTDINISIDTNVPTLEELRFEKILKINTIAVILNGILKVLNYAGQKGIGYSQVSASTRFI